VDLTVVKAARRRGTHGGGGTCCEPGSSRGEGWRFTGVDPVVVGEVVGEDSMALEAVEERADTWMAAK
jgi:hypothetical protein